MHNQVLANKSYNSAPQKILFYGSCSQPAGTYNVSHIITTPFNGMKLFFSEKKLEMADSKETTHFPALPIL